ncbi:DeoR/GlpR family DNA-binding transcription regulator [Enterococcus faecalis]|uniref:DeoR/GlpR family DNA-binding transcription regulator n=1 Tax=Enterococcus faecalis TaxID=1351 RepID=UPI004042630C
MNKRQEAIVEYLKKNKTIKNSYIAKKFNVSSETARKDLELLEESGIAKKIYGGAYYNQKFVNETDYLYRQNLNRVEKRKIAKKAIEFVSENQIIGLDVSTTNTQIAAELPHHFKNLTVVTNSVIIAVELSKRSCFQIVMPGGLIKNDELCFVGEFSADYLKQFHIDVFFMSFSGISLINGFTDYGFGEASLKKQMIKNSSIIYGVGDFSKFDSTSLLSICPLHQVSAVITDDQLSPVTAYNYEKCGVPIFIGER